MSVPAVQCRATARTGKQCKEQGDPWWDSVPISRGANPHVASKAAVRAEVWSWGLGDTNVDPGEVLLRLVTQSAARAERYAMLLEEADEAAERLKSKPTMPAHRSRLLVTSSLILPRPPVVILIGSSTPVAWPPLSATRMAQPRT